MKFKSQLVRITFFATVNHNYDHKQQTLKQKLTKWIETTNHSSQTMTFSILIHGSKLFLISLANWVDWRQQKTQTVVGFWSWRVIESHSNLANVPFHWRHLCFYSCCNFVFINKQLELSPAITRSLIGWKRVLYESCESIKTERKLSHHLPIVCFEN